MVSNRATDFEHHLNLKGTSEVYWSLHHSTIVLMLIHKNLFFKYWRRRGLMFWSW